jgi:hypothetical protein
MICHLNVVGPKSLAQCSIGTKLRNRLLTCDTLVTLASQSIKLVLEL